jgi:hypothetical protein
MFRISLLREMFRETLCEMFRETFSETDAEQAKNFAKQPLLSFV